MSGARQLTIATRNRHKTAEIAEMLGGDWAIGDLHGHPLPEPEESGATFEQNAIIKALAASAALPGRLVLADDSGLEVDALGGEPGVRSARYAGAQSSDEANRRHLLGELARRAPGLEVLAARFHCVLALARDGEVLKTFAGKVEGRIVRAEAGVAGFGYDPLFIPDGYAQTFGELDAAIKNRISHRANALALAVPWLLREV